jgi:hypothetical protein
MRPYTLTEWDTLPHVILTSDVEWDYGLDHTLMMTMIGSTLLRPQDDPTRNLFDEFGNYRKRVVVRVGYATFFDTIRI